VVSVGKIVQRACDLRQGGIVGLGTHVKDVIFGQVPVLVREEPVHHAATHDGLVPRAIKREATRVGPPHFIGKVSKAAPLGILGRD
jgi:hypothetical protein